MGKKDSKRKLSLVTAEMTPDCATPWHRYPTRWKLGRHKTSSPSHSLVPRVKDMAIDIVLVPCKGKKEEKHIIYFPREIIFKILVFLSAKVLHEVMKYVCKQWYDIVSDPLFIVVHRQLSSGSFIIQKPKEMFQVYNIETCGAELKVTEIRFPLPVRVLGSFNGLLLLHDVTNPDILHVMNPVTKGKISLPPLAKLSEYNTGFALDSSGHYKVVHVCGVPRTLKVEMRILTVGGDKAWRFVDLHSIYVEREDLFMSHQVYLRKKQAKRALMYRQHFIAGFIYWFCSNSFIGFALDVNTETIYRFYPPSKDIFRECRAARFVSMGTCLGLLKEEWRGLWRLWKLTGVKTGEWTEVAGINMQPALNRFSKMFYPSKCGVFWPACLINEDFWFYRCIDKEFFVVRYSLANESFAMFPIKDVCESSLLIPHMHTLVSPKKLLASSCAT